jgi:hypothetical protein
MQHWVEAQLDAIWAATDEKFATTVREFCGLSPETRQAFLKRVLPNRTPRDVAHRTLLINAAERGDIKPLRKEVEKIDSRYGRFVNLPRLRRGRHFKKKPPPTDDLRTPHGRLQEARHEWLLVPAIWKEHYGQVRRRVGQLTAVEILAERWGLTDEEIRRNRLSRKRIKGTRR